MYERCAMSIQIGPICGAHGPWAPRANGSQGQMGSLGDSHGNCPRDPHETPPWDPRGIPPGIPMGPWGTPFGCHGESPVGPKGLGANLNATVDFP